MYMYMCACTYRLVSIKGLVEQARVAVRASGYLSTAGLGDKEQQQSSNDALSEGFGRNAWVWL